MNEQPTPDPATAPRPTPQNWTITQVPGPNGEKWLQVTIAGHSGIFVAYLGPEAAREILRVFTFSVTGLVVVRPGDPGNNGR